MTSPTRRVLAAVGVAVVLGVGASACGAESESTTPDAATTPAASSANSATPTSGADASGSSPEDDVTIQACGRDIDSGKGKARVLISNGTNAVASYVFLVAFIAEDGTPYASQPAPVIEPLVEPGAGVPLVDVTSRSKINGKFTCKITDLQRKP